MFFYLFSSLESGEIKMRACRLVVELLHTRSVFYINTHVAPAIIGLANAQRSIRFALLPLS